MNIFNKKCPFCGSKDTERTNLEEKIMEAAGKAIVRGGISFVGRMFNPNFRLPPSPKSMIPMKFRCHTCGNTWQSFYVEGQNETIDRTSNSQNAVVDTPSHIVTPELIKVDGNSNISDFYIGKYPVTQSQWTSVMESNPSHFRGDNLPVETVSWDDAYSFIKKINQMTGKKYRLPNLIEWEYAAKGGLKSQGYKYSGSNNINEVAWYGVDSTQLVGQKKPNELGIYDMTGNVWEWCGKISGSQCIICGGAWNNKNINGVCSSLHIAYCNRDKDTGFRLAMDA